MTTERFREACKHLAEKDGRLEFLQDGQVWALMSVEQRPILIPFRAIRCYGKGDLRCSQDSLDELAGMLGRRFLIKRFMTDFVIQIFDLDWVELGSFTTQQTEKLSISLEAATAIIYAVHKKEPA